MFSYNTILSLLLLLNAPAGYNLLTKCVIYIKTMRHSCLFSDKYKFNANVRGKDHKIKIHHFVA